jgi:IS5 family transposase
MQPSSKKTDKRLDLFRERLGNILNPNHELCRLAGLIAWDVFEQELGKFYSLKKGGRISSSGLWSG